MGYFWARRFKALAVTALSVLAASAVAACGSTAHSSGSGGGSGGLEKTHLTVGALAVADDAPLYIAIKDGFFKQAGLDVKAVPVAQSTQAIPDMLRGSVDVIAGANYVSFFQAESKGVVKFTVLADGTHCQSGTFQVMALPGSGIKSPADLAGKKVAVNLTSNVQTLTLNTVLKKDGVSPSSVQYVEVPFPDMVAALKAHRVDAISAIEPYITGSEQQDGAKSVVSQCAGPTAGFPLSGYFATSTWAQRYPNTAKAFSKALDKAQALADRQPSAVRAILPTYTKVTPAEAKVLKLNTYPPTVSAAAMNQVASLMLSGGLLSKKLDVSSMMSP